VIVSRLVRRDVWSGALLLAVGGAVAAAAASHQVGSLARPGPGFLGFYVGLVIVVMGAGVLIGALRAGAMPSLAQSLAGMRSAPAMIVPMLAFCLLLERIGFLLAGFLLMWWLFAVAGGGFRSPRPALYGLLATAGTWLLFDRLLGSGLPGLPF
jgi:putative tricarboxylic transport membrane protein